MGWRAFPTIDAIDGGYESVHCRPVQGTGNHEVPVALEVATFLIRQAMCEAGRVHATFAPQQLSSTPVGYLWTPRRGHQIQPRDELFSNHAVEPFRAHSP